MTRTLLLKAIEKAGSEEKLGRALGVSQNAIWQAKRKGRVSPVMAANLHAWSKGEIPKHKLRPDLWSPAESR